MFKNYLKITLRNLGKQKVYAFINIVGLAVGIAFCALIFLYVRDELTFDRFHERADRIFRITQQEMTPEGSVESAWAWQPMPLAPTLIAEIPEVAAAVRFFDQTLFVRRGEVTFEEGLIFADPSIFDVFSFPLQRGDKATVLTDHNSIVLSQHAAHKYFGDEDPVGQTLEVRFGDTFENVIVTGILDTIPGNSSVQFNYLMPFDKLPDAYEWIANRTDRWTVSSFYTYVLLNDRASAQAVEAKLPVFRALHIPEEIERARAEGWTAEGPPRTYGLQPMRTIHLDTSVQGGLTVASDPKYSYILAGIALAILLIACINFMTLAIGRSAGRAREIGIRKVVGAQRRQLMLQFWGEALLMSMLALGIGIALAELMLPTFNTLAAKALSFDYLQNGATLAALIGLVALVGLLAGCYPALVLSGLRPIESLNQRLRLGGSNLLTKSLVVVQFALSVFLIVGTLVMLRQLDYLQSKNLGFNQEHVVVIPTNDLPGSRLLERFRQDLGGRADIAGITGMNNAFTRGWSREGWDYRGEQKRAYVYGVDANFLEVMGIELVAGRTFDPNLATDSTDVVLVNEAFVRDFGWTEPIGEKIDGFYNEPIVAGVFKDINYLSLHRAIDPMVLSINPDWSLHHLLVRIVPTDIPATLDALRGTWQTSVPDVPFQYSFLDEDLNKQYANEQRWSKIVGYGASFAILIACLGLFGLAALSVTGRTKEVGIRKVLGASITSVTVLLSKDFARLVLIAIAIAAPIAYLGMQRWLDDFAYRIDISWPIFLVAGLIALGVALLTVSYQAIKAAWADPVKSLRYE